MQLSHGCGIPGVKSPDLAWVAACTQEVNRLNDWEKKLGANEDVLKAYAQKLDDEQSENSQAEALWVKKYKQNNSDLNDIGAALTDWSQRYNAFVFQSATYDRLVHTNQGIQQCAQLGDNPTIGDLEVAHHCLQWLWDGATR
jgi:hypothetical protein